MDDVGGVEKHTPISLWCVKVYEHLCMIVCASPVEENAMRDTSTVISSTIQLLYNVYFECAVVPISHEQSMYFKFSDKR